MSNAILFSIRHHMPSVSSISISATADCFKMGYALLIFLNTSTLSTAIVIRFSPNEIIAEGNPKSTPAMIEKSSIHMKPAPVDPRVINNQTPDV